MFLPKEVINEFEKLSMKSTGDIRDLAKLCLDLINANKGRFKIINLNNDYVDQGIVGFVEEKREKGEGNIAVATLDKELKKRLKGKSRILTLKARKRIGFG